MVEMGQIKHRAMGFVLNTANAMQKVFQTSKEEEEEKPAEHTSKRKYSRPMSHDEIAMMMFGDGDNDVIGTMNLNPLFKKSLSHMRLGELMAQEAATNATASTENSSNISATLQVPQPIRQSLTQELLDNPEKIESMNKFKVVDQLLTEFDERLTEFLNSNDVQGPEWESIKQSVKANQSELQNLQIPPPQPPAIQIEGETLSSDEFDDEETQERLLGGEEEQEQAGGRLAPGEGLEPGERSEGERSDGERSNVELKLESFSTQVTKRKHKGSKRWSNMKNRVRGLLSTNKEKTGYGSEFESNNELDRALQGEQ